MQYQAKPKLSPKKTDRSDRASEKDVMMLNQEPHPINSQLKPMPRVKKYTRQEIENRPGKYDADNFYILPDGDFFDPQGFYFDRQGFDQLGGRYDELTGHYIPGTKYANCTLQKNQSYNAGDTRSAHKKNRFTGFDNYGTDDTQLRRNYGSFHAHQSQGFN